MKLGNGTNIYEIFKKPIDEARRILEMGSVAGIRIVFLTNGEPTNGPKKPKKILKVV